ncbi:cobyrinate a,c-diamide synthase [Halococcoides cellulosivorans]|uniref:Cobyrinic acid a,c-diamide synthase n=1 Tax=Halococcoides cellulosivorans TaxID=1679096 RepID=A0A2R4X4E8_9EURY|nr:cobyrinate a,c-diamide synthase [Halococcoides cellulosivorans]AWB28669.1 cobyrinic acid a,c-diamide synthase [Halococcoides cellulosivorans]
MPGVVLAGTGSSVGKTVTTLAALAGFREQGVTVQPAKAGPDYVDPSQHTAIADRPSRTLDPWLSGPRGCLANYARGSGDLCVVEGVMGLYDGTRASTASVAATLGLPVVLVVDASGAGRSIAATVEGFRRFADRAPASPEVAGVIFQRARDGPHLDRVRAALPDGIVDCGRISPDDALAIPDRHLGLYQGTETTIDRDALARAAEDLRLDRIRALARRPRASGGVDDRSARTLLSKDDRPTIAVARDRAFTFCYPGVRERLGRRANVRPFAPTRGDPLPPADAVYLPGGYPERFAPELADSPALADLARRASEGLPVFGECGGLIALAESLTVDGQRHAMAGVLPADVRMTDRPQAIGHVELSARRDSPIASPDTTIQGHEFHYSTATARDARYTFDTDGTGLDGCDGLTEYSTVGTYAHLHAASGVFDSLLDAARSESHS